MDNKVMDVQSINQIPYDDYSDDTSDSSGDETSSILAVASKVDSFRYENGRRYHGYRDGTYWGANDDMNAAYEKVVHHLFLRCLKDRLHLAPVSNPKRIAELGCGTGLWSMDIADMYEHAEVLGVDLSPVQPSAQPNLRFEVDDITSEWTETQKFDFIYMRSLYGSVEDWNALYRQCFNQLEPGGYIEQVEFSLIPYSANGTISRDNFLWRLVELSDQFSKITKKPLFIAETMHESIQEAGFVDVTQHTISLPIGSWSSDEEYQAIGKWFKQVWWAGCEGWIMASATRLMGWSRGDVVDFCQGMKDEISRKSQHYFYQAKIVHARKPT